MKRSERRKRVRNRINRYRNREQSREQNNTLPVKKRDYQEEERETLKGDKVMDEGKVRKE